jgi:flagellar biosynthetic protein FliR
VGELVELAQRLELTGHLVALVLVLARVTPLVVLLPFLGGSSLSPAVRTVVALAVAAVVFPAASSGPLGDLPGGFVLVLMLKEALVGTCLGLLGAVVFHTLAMTGQLVDQARGVTTASVTDPMTGEEMSPLASFHLQLAVALFLLMGGHRAFLAAVAGSYETIPLGELPISDAGTRDAALLLARLVGGAIAAALMLAGPAISAIVLTDLALGLLGRTAPQIGTYFMAMPLRAAVGLAMALLSLSVVFDEIGTFLGQAVAVVQGAVRLLGP